MVYKNIFYNPIGRIFQYSIHGKIIEFTEMRTVDKNHDTLELPEIYNHIVDYKDLWIIDLSTQIGCPQKCRFCDVSLKTKFVRNLTDLELFEQFKIILDNTNYVKKSNNLKIFFARMGEPLYNVENILKAKNLIKNYLKGKDFNVSFNFTTMLPKTFSVDESIKLLNEVKNQGFNISISLSTLNEDKRNKLYVSNYHSLDDMMKVIKDIRNVTINLLSIDEKDFDSEYFKELYDIEELNFRISECCINDNCEKNNIQNNDNYLKTLNDKKIKYLYVPYFKKYGLSCGQLLK